jgi:hypothetical protein
LRVPEPRPEHDAAHDCGAVRGVDHVGQAGHRIEQVDAVAQVEVGAAQRVPLGEGEIPVDRDSGMHPRIDRVPDVEVLRAAHEVAAWLGRSLGRGARPRQDAGHGSTVGMPITSGNRDLLLLGAPSVRDPRSIRLIVA